MKESEMRIPLLFRCPISLDLFKDPVTLSTGQTYDRSSIEKWLSCGNSTCPVTMQKLHDSSIVPNTTLRHLIDQWIQINCSSHHHGYFQTLDDDDLFVVLKNNLKLKESTLDTKVEALEKILALSEDLPFDNFPLIQLDFFQMILELVLENAEFVEENVMFVEKSLACGLKLLPYSDLGTLDMMIKEDESKFTNFLILFKKGTFTIKKSLCHFIVAISSSLHTKEVLSMFGKSKILIQELVHLIENDSYGLFEESIKALSSLSSLEQNRVVIVKENAVKVLITYIVNAPKCQYRSIFGLVMAMKTIETLLVIESAKQQVMDHPNGVSEIVKMVFRVSSDNESSESAINCLIILCQDFIDVREKAICCGILTKLLLLLQSQCSERTKNKARMLLKLLRSMCIVDKK